MVRLMLAGLSLALAAVPALAQEQGAMVVGAKAPAILRAGTPVSFQTDSELTTRGNHLKVGDRFSLQVADPVVIDGKVAIPVGSSAVGEITSIRNKGMWGKSGNIETRLLYLTANGRMIRLTGSVGNKGVKAGGGAIATSAIVFLPAGFFMTGTSAVIPPGTRVSGLLAEDVPIVFADDFTAAPMMVSGSAATNITPVSALVQPLSQSPAPSPTAPK